MAPAFFWKYVSIRCVRIVDLKTVLVKMVSSVGMNEVL